MKAILKKTIVVDTWDTLMSISEIEKNSDIYQCILQYADEQGGSITHDQINTAFWMTNKDDARGILIFKTLVRDKHLTETGELTAYGKDEVRDNCYYKTKPELPYRIEIIDDPLFQFHLYSYEQTELKWGEKTIIDHPKWLSKPDYPIEIEDENPKCYLIPAQDHEKLYVHKISSEIYKGSGTVKFIEATVSISSLVSAEITDTNRKTKIEIPLSELAQIFQDMEANELLRNLAKRLDISWENGDGNIQVSYQDLSDDEKRSGTRSISIPNPGYSIFVNQTSFNYSGLFDYGHSYRLKMQNTPSFDSGELNGIMLRPRTLIDALKWTVYRILRNVTTYLSENEYESLCKKEITWMQKRIQSIVSLDDLKSSLPSYTQLINMIIKDNNYYFLPLIPIIREFCKQNPAVRWYFIASQKLTFTEGDA